MAGQRTRFDKHSGKILVSFWLCVGVAGLAVFEWVLTPDGGTYEAIGSISGPGPERKLMLRELEPSTHYRFAPPPERLRYVTDGIRELYEVTTDAQGFIEPALRHDNPDLSIVFMGGSTTECLFVAPQNRFPYLAARKLEAELGLKINGINAARSGNNSLHSILLLLGKVIPLRPDYVVLMEATNDVGTLKRGTYWSQGGSKRIIDVQRISLDQSIRILTNATIPYTSDLVGRSSRTIKNLFCGSQAKADSTFGIQSTEKNREREVMGREFASALRSFVSLTRAWGIAPVLMTQVKVRARTPAEKESHFLTREQRGGARVSSKDFATTQEYFNSIIRKVAASQNVQLIDLARAHEWSFGDVYDSIHFTDQGSKRVAEIIATKLREVISEENATTAPVQESGASGRMLDPG